MKKQLEWERTQTLFLHAQGWHANRIAYWLNVNPNTVRGWLSKAGATRKKEPRRVDVTEAEKPSRLASVSLSAPRRHFVIPDTQVKDGIGSLEHLVWAARYAAEQKPDVVIHLGDHWDMPSLSSYDKGKKSFEGRRYKADVAAGNYAMNLFIRSLGNWRPERMVFLIGNHEERIERAVESDSILEGTIGYKDLALDEWEVIPYRKPVIIDGLTYAHYFYNPMTGRPYSGAIETMLRNIGFSFVMGHQQGLRWGRRELNNGKTQTGLVAGSFYQHDEEYIGPQANDHWRGVCVLHEVANGTYDPMFVSLNYLKRRFHEHR